MEDSSCSKSVFQRNFKCLENKIEKYEKKWCNKTFVGGGTSTSFALPKYFNKET